MTNQPDYLCHPACLEARKADAEMIERLQAFIDFVQLRKQWNHYSAPENWIYGSPNRDSEAES